MRNRAARKPSKTRGKVVPPAPSPSRLDPTRTGGLRKVFAAHLRKVFERIEDQIDEFVAKSDGLALASRSTTNATDATTNAEDMGTLLPDGTILIPVVMGERKLFHVVRPTEPAYNAHKRSLERGTLADVAALNVFCSTGKGGGVDPTCGEGNGSAGGGAAGGSGGGVGAAGGGSGTGTGAGAAGGAARGGAAGGAAGSGPRTRVLDKNHTHEGVDKKEAKTITPEKAKEAISWHDGMTMVGKNTPSPHLPEESRPTNLTPLEKGALQKYSYFNDRPLNAKVRGGQLPADVPYGPAYYEELEKGLDSAMAKVKPFKKPVQVARGMNLPPEQLQSFVNDVMQARESGGNVTMKGYTSTAKRGMIQSMVGGKIPKAFRGNVTLTINATKGIDMGPTSQLPGESEMLLPKNSQFKVKRVVKKADGYHIELDQHPDAPTANTMKHWLPATNAFCPTGAGGGVDPGCGKNKEDHQQNVETTISKGLRVLGMVKQFPDDVMAAHMPGRLQTMRVHVPKFDLKKVLREDKERLIERFTHISDLSASAAFHLRGEDLRTAMDKHAKAIEEYDGFKHRLDQHGINEFSEEGKKIVYAIRTAKKAHADAIRAIVPHLIEHAQTANAPMPVPDEDETAPKPGEEPDPNAEVDATKEIPENLRKFYEKYPARAAHWIDQDSDFMEFDTGDAEEIDPELETEEGDSGATATANFRGDQPRDAAGRFAAIGQGMVDTVKKLGHGVHVLEQAAKDKVVGAIHKLPHAIQTSLSVGMAAAFATWTTGQHVAQKVSEERGHSPEEAKRFRGLLMTLDIATFKPLTLAMIAGGMDPATAGLLSFVPPATAGYLAYSTARHPLATYRAAKRVVKETATALGKGAKKALDHGERALEMMARMTGNVEEPRAVMLAAALERHNFDDWYIALLSAARVQFATLSEAIEIADGQYVAHPCPDTPHCLPFPTDILNVFYKKLARKKKRQRIANVFCSTGIGGGVDPTCGKDTKPRKFATREALESWATEHLHAPWAARATKEEKEAIRQYTSEGGERINALLADKKLTTHPSVDRLDSAMAKSPTPETLVAYRGIDEFEASKYIDLEGSEIGGQTYISTSLDPQVAKTFARKHGADIVVRIVVPKGTQAIFPGKLSDADEAELLIGRGNKLRIDKIHYKDDDDDPPPGILRPISVIDMTIVSSLTSNIIAPRGDDLLRVFSYVINPFTSKAQWRKCFAMGDPKWDCHKWAHETKSYKKLRRKKRQQRIANIFCSTGTGGGVDPTCTVGQGSASKPDFSKPDTLIGQKIKHSGGEYEITGHETATKGAFKGQTVYKVFDPKSGKTTGMAPTNVQWAMTAYETAKAHAAQSTPASAPAQAAVATPLVPVILGTAGSIRSDNELATSIGASKHVPDVKDHYTYPGTAQFHAEHPHAKQWTGFDRHAPNPKLPDSARPSVHTPEAAKSLDHYSWGYDGPMNKALRATNTHPPGMFGGDTQNYKGGKPDIHGPTMFNNVQSLIERVKPFDVPVTVSRAITVQPAIMDRLHDAASQAIDTGGSVEMRGFISTTTGSNLGGNTEFVIKARKGLDMKPYSEFPDEDELLMAHGSRFRIVSSSKKNGGLTVHMEQVLPGEPGYDKLSAALNAIVNKI